MSRILTGSMPDSSNFLLTTCSHSAIIAYEAIELQKGGESLKNRIKEVRKEHGLSQTRLSELSGVHRVSIARYELGVNAPTAENLMKIAEAMNVSIDELVKKGA